MPTLNGPDGKAVHISNDNQLLVQSSIEDKALWTNVNKSDVYTVMVDVTPATIDDDFFYLQNTDVKDLIITRIEGWCALDQEISVYIGATDAGTGAGDALIPANMNAGSAKTADVVCTQDVTDLAITGGRIVRLLKFSPTALTHAEFNFPEGLIIPQNQRLHMQAALASLINLNITFFFNQ